MRSAEIGLVENINDALSEPAVSSVQGGSYGGGTVLTDVGQQVIQIYHSVEGLTLTSAHDLSATAQFLTSLTSAPMQLRRFYGADRYLTYSSKRR